MSTQPHHVSPGPRDSFHTDMPAGFSDAMKQVAWDARKIAYAQNRWHISADDLAQEGFTALVTAARRFDPTRNVPFVAYAMIRTHGAMQDYLRKYGHRKGRPAPPELASLDEIQEHADLIPDQNWQIDPERRALMNAEAEEIEEAILGLEPKRQNVVTQRRAGKTLREIAKAEGLSITRVAELWWDAARKIRRQIGATP